MGDRHSRANSQTTAPVNREMMQKTVLRLEAMHALITAGAGKHDRNIVKLPL